MKLPKKASKAVSPAIQQVEAALEVSPPVFAADSVGEVPRSRLYGQPTTFGSAPWWDGRGWWKVSGVGEANDIRCHVGTHAGLSLAAVSLRGNKHRLQGSQNEDSYCIRTARHNDSGDEYLVAVVCDGMGSAAFSAYGARLAAHLMADHLVRLLADVQPSDVRSTLVEYQTRIIAAVSKEVASYRSHEFEAPSRVPGEVTIDHMQCTVTFAIVPPPVQDGPRNAVVGFVGDSPAFQFIDGSWLPIEPAKNHEGVWSSSTQGLLGASEFLVAPVELYGAEGLLLTSDGVGNFLIYEGEPTALGRDLAALWSVPVPMLDFVRDASFELQSADDDRTAIMIWT